MPPAWLIRIAVASVWLYEGLWCKVLGRLPQQKEIVAAVPMFGPVGAKRFLVFLGWAEGALGVWILTGRLAFWAALTQTVVLAAMNTVGIMFARKSIHDPAGMVLKNGVLIVLAWVAAAPYGN